VSAIRLEGTWAYNEFRQELGAVLSDKDFARAIARIRELGWYAKSQPEKDGIVSSVEKYQSLDVPVPIDHMARPDPTRGKCDPMLELLSKGNFWVMLSLGEKSSTAGPPWDDVIPIARIYIEAEPDRCVWASDWPHPVSVVQPPNDADLLELMYRYAPDEATLRKILVDNPARLFGVS
jgi:predicted TIM-barrel fold metal-dependent hydrolase